MTLRTKPAAPWILDCIEGETAAERRRRHEPFAKLRMHEVHERLREGDAAIDSEVAQLLDDVESQLAQNPADKKLSRLKQALSRYRTDAAAEADMMGIGDDDNDAANDNDALDDDEDQDDNE